MKESSLEDLVKKEQKKLIRELKRAKISEHKMKVFESVISNSAWMKVKLDEARELMKDAEIIVEYDNGGGQKGQRENPIYKAYEALWKAYMLGMGRILDAIPNENKEEIEARIEEVKPQTVLEMIREKHG